MALLNDDPPVQPAPGNPMTLFGSNCSLVWKRLTADKADADDGDGGAPDARPSQPRPTPTVEPSAVPENRPIDPRAADLEGAPPAADRSYNTWRDRFEELTVSLLNAFRNACDRFRLVTVYGMPPALEDEYANDEHSTAATQRL